MSEQITEACKVGNLIEVKELIKSGADVNTKNKYGNTPLSCATYYGHTEIAELLKQNKGE